MLPLLLQLWFEVSLQRGRLHAHAAKDRQPALAVRCRGCP